MRMVSELAKRVLLLGKYLEIDIIKNSGFRVAFLVLKTRYIFYCKSDTYFCLKFYIQPYKYYV